MKTHTTPSTHRIAVGVDGSDRGWAALQWACEASDAPATTLTICLARPAHGPVQPIADMASMELFDPVLARHVHAVRDRLGGHRVGVELPVGDPATALLGLARRTDLLVLGGSAHVPHGIHGTVVTRVAARTSTPLVVVRPVPAHPESRLFAGHVVVGVDGTGESRPAIRFAFEYARRYHRPLAAVHVATAPPDDFWFDETMLETQFGTVPAPMALLAAEIEPVAREYHDVPVKRVVCPGRPVPALRRAAGGAYLLVLGRRGGTSRVMRFGSVAHAFAADAACVVAIVPGEH
jgi:nucleotide-binding universal stress UspA family protein